MVDYKTGTHFFPPFICDFTMWPCRSSHQEVESVSLPLKSGLLIALASEALAIVLQVDTSFIRTCPFLLHLKPCDLCFHSLALTSICSSDMWLRLLDHPATNQTPIWCHTHEQAHQRISWASLDHKCPANQQNHELSCFKPLSFVMVC